MEIIYIFLGTVGLIFITWIIYRIADGEISRIFKWAITLYIVIAPINIIMWIFESFITQKLFAIHNITPFLLFINTVYAIMLVIANLIYKKYQKRNACRNVGYGIVYRVKSSEYSNIYFQQKAMMLLTFSLVINPLINLWFFIDYIKQYILV